MQRRKLLGLLGGSLTVGLAGCLGNGDDDNGDDGNGDDDNGDDDGGDDSLLGGEFRAESTEGLVIFGESGDESDFRDDGFGLPPSGEITDPVVMEAEIHDDGTWESSEIDFPPLDLGLPDISPQVEAPDGFSGEIDEEAGVWTVSGELRVTLVADGEEFTLDFPLDATTEGSGSLDGSFERDGDTIFATIVDNESVVEDQFGNTFVDQSLDLPAPFEGDNWFELVMEIEAA